MNPLQIARVKPSASRTIRWLVCTGTKRQPSNETAQTMFPAFTAFGRLQSIMLQGLDLSVRNIRMLPLVPLGAECTIGQVPPRSCLNRCRSTSPQVLPPTIVPPLCLCNLMTSPRGKL